MNTIDLQIQSIASDGKHAPREIVMMAKELGLRTIALTDHDTVAGLREAAAAGQELGIAVIPGIELSVEEHNAHLLGYGIDYQNQELLQALEEYRQSRIEGAKKIVENLRVNEGLVIEWEDVVKEAAGASTVTRPHIVYAAMKRPENKEKLAENGVHDKGSFFEKYLSDKSRNFVKRAHVSAKDAIALVHRAGGVAVWSHPPIPDFQGGKYDELEEFLKELVNYGINGLEVFSASHTEDDAEFLEAAARRHNLLRTAGSDFHERGEHTRFSNGLHSADRLGDYETHGFSIDDIVPDLHAAIALQRCRTNIPEAGQ